MTAYSMTLSGDVLAVGFVDPATDVEVVLAAKDLIDELRSEVQGKHLKINGAMAATVATMMGHGFGNTNQTVSVFSPKLQKYLVVISFVKDIPVGTVID